MEQSATQSKNILTDLTCRLLMFHRASEAASNTGKLFPNKSQDEMFYPHRKAKANVDTTFTAHCKSDSESALAL